MKTYNIGYFNKPWDKTCFTIIAKARSLSAAEFIQRSYNEAYEKNGMTLRLEILENKELPTNSRFVD